jgi:predicted permease
MFRRPTKSEVSHDVRTFLAERTDQLIAQGLSPEEARAEALRRLGDSPEHTAARLHRDIDATRQRMHVRELLDSVRQDFRYTLRSLRRDAGFTTFAVSILALGLAASATVFSVTNALLLRDLPLPQAENLLWIANNVGEGVSGQTFQAGHVLDLAARSKTLASVAGYYAFTTAGDQRLTTREDSVRLNSMPVTEAFFTTLGVQLALGRNFNASESTWRGPAAAILSHELWAGRFAADPSIVGRVITLNDAAIIVVGVTPASFDFGSVFAPGTKADLFLPFPLTKETNSWGNTLAVVGRLAPGVTVDSVRSELKTLASSTMAEQANRNPFRPQVTLLSEHVTGAARPALLLLSGAVFVVMLILCANLSNLLLARATTRQREMAIRAALGAGRRRLLRQTLTESLVLSVCGGMPGLALAFMATQAIASMTAVDLPLLRDVRLDVTAVAFTSALALITGLVFGIVPAIRMRDAALQAALKDGGRGVLDGRRGRWTRRSLVVSEIALACVLLFGAGLLTRSFFKIMSVDLGFAPDHIASVRVDPPSDRLTSQEKFIAYVDDVLRLSKQVPGAKAVGLTDRLPFTGNRSWSVRAKGRVYTRATPPPEAFIRMISDGYVDAMGMRLVAGRDLTRQDRGKSEQVILVNESMARTLWPGEDAIGQMMITDHERRVVGVVADVRHVVLEESSGPEVFMPIRQTGDFSAVGLVMRTTMPPDAVGTSLKSALASVVSNLPANQVETMRRLVDKTVSPRRFVTMLLGGFAMFALTLALLGIYGVISYTVGQRRQEFGVRLALGASASRIQRGVIRETLQLAAVGVAIGTVASLLLGRTLGSLLFGVTGNDAVTLVAMLLTVAAVAVAGGYLPARRASRIDPATAFRTS